MNEQKTTPPNAIDLALDALRGAESDYEMFAGARVDEDREAMRIYSYEVDFNMKRAAILAQVAIAQAIVALTNTVGDGLLSQLAEMDADNAALIARCRQVEPIEVPE